MASGLTSSIGRRLKALRKTRGLTQAELGEMVGLAPITIRRYERAERDLDIDTWILIASKLGISKEDATFDYLSDEADDFKSLKDTVKDEERIKAKGQELLMIYFDLSEEGQKKVLAYAKDMQGIYGGILNRLSDSEQED